ncbi:hypothetical protein HGRIS_001773 [Hohenbuehelia grisea]|uniref:Thiolase N-terminal domain-containing protein n=1 Tax=Hohenbuehelia grisea TaxID=104357 RepID=A0ABR3JIF0_9AGAR
MSSNSQVSLLEAAVWAPFNAKILTVSSSKWPSIIAVQGEEGVDELMLELFKHSILKSHIDHALVNDITVATVMTPNAMYHARAAAMAADFPRTTDVQVVNRFCSSGLMAVTSSCREQRRRTRNSGWNDKKEILGMRRSAFPQWTPSTTTGSNASQITDGAAAMLLMTRRKANELRLKIMACLHTLWVLALFMPPLKP